MNQKTLHEQLKKIQEKHQNSYELALRRVYLNAYDDIMKEVAYLDKKDTLKVSELLRKNRYMNLKEQISDVLASLGEKQIVSGIEAGLKDGYYGLAYEISKAANKDIMWGLLNTNTVQAAIWHSDMTIDIIKTFNKDDWRRRIPKNLKDSESFLRQIFDKNHIAQKAAVWNALNQSLITGASYQSTARSVRDAFDKGYNQALRVMRTEGHKATMIGELTASQYATEQGVDLQEFWMATLDMRTRPSHKAMDNKFKNEEGFFVLPNGVTTSAPGITGIAEEDIHCRCTIGYVVDGVAPDQRRIGGEVINVEKDYEKFVYELKTPEKKKVESIAIDLSKYPWFKESVHDEHKQYFEKAFKNMPEEAKRLWNKVGNKVQGEFYALKSGQGYYRAGENKIYMSLAQPNKMISNNKILGYDNVDICAFFHEVGHWFDYNLDRGLLPLNLKIPKFEKLIKEDFFDWVNANTGEKISKYKKYTLTKLNNDVNFTKFLSSKLKNEDRKFNNLLIAVSDLFGGITNNQVCGRHYHKNDYWIAGNLEAEAFAHMFQALCLGGELDRLVSQYLPKSYQAFKEYLKEVK